MPDLTRFIQYHGYAYVRAMIDGREYCAHHVTENGLDEIRTVRQIVKSPGAWNGKAARKLNERRESVIRAELAAIVAKHDGSQV